jgi:transposase
MAYITKRKNREGKTYVYLVEGYRDKNKVRTRILKTYGQLELLEESEPGAYERLRQEAKEGIIGNPELKEIMVTYQLDEPISYDNKNYGWKLFDDVYHELGISHIIGAHMKKSKVEFNVDEVLRLLAFQRILNPGSKLATVASQSELFGNWTVTENAMYRSLSYLDELKEAIQLIIHKTITDQIGRVATLVFYDVTNYRFDIDINDEDTIDEATGIITDGLRKKGACKSNGKNPIVQMGLFMDTNGIPICYKLFRGNMPDVSTYREAVRQVKEQFGIERIVVVADKAMNSGNNIYETSENKDGWLFSQKHRGKRGVCKELQAFILDPSGWQFNESVTFGQKSMIRERIIRTSDKPVKTKKVTEKVLVTWSEKYANREQIRRDGAIDYALKLTNPEIFRQTCKRGGKKYLELYTLDKETNEKQPFAPFIELDQEAIDFDAKFDGINVLVTSELNMSDEEIMRNYKELAKIEDNFRVTKTDFESRPVYVKKTNHIDAHFLSCFVALVLMRIVQHQIGYSMSAGKIINAVQSAQANALTNGFYKVQANDSMQELNRLLGIEWDKAIVTHEQLKSYASAVFTTSKKSEKSSETS